MLYPKRRNDKQYPLLNVVCVMLIAKIGRITSARRHYSSTKDCAEGCYWTASSQSWSTLFYGLYVAGGSAGSNNQAARAYLTNNNHEDKTDSLDLLGIEFHIA